ncbi:hypothetical protein Tco_0778420, partial [Tanacetum coccineum]
SIIADPAFLDHLPASPDHAPVLPDHLPGAPEPEPAFPNHVVDVPEEDDLAVEIEERLEEDQDMDMDIEAEVEIEAKAEENDGDMINIGVVVVHPEPDTSTVFPMSIIFVRLVEHEGAIQGMREHLLEMPTQRLEEIEEELRVQRERTDVAEAERITLRTRVRSLEIITPRLPKAIAEYERNRANPGGARGEGENARGARAGNVRGNIALEARGYKVMYDACTLQGHALTWWNGYVHSLGIDAANQIP